MCWGGDRQVGREMDIWFVDEGEFNKAKICTGCTTHILRSALCYNKLAFPLAVTLYSDGFVINWLNYSFILNLLLDREKL